jgi:hypothetical protein
MSYVSSTNAQYSDTQQIALAIAPKATAGLSMVASVYAIQYILRSAYRRGRANNRIFVCMLLHDLVRCATHLVGTWAIPETPGVYLSSGTPSSCAAQAFFSQLGLAVPCYVTALIVYFFSCIKYDYRISKVDWLEKWIHIVCNLLPLLLAALLLVFNLYGSDGSRCWVPPTLNQCNDRDFAAAAGVTCTDGMNLPFPLYRFINHIFSCSISTVAFLTTLVLLIATFFVERRKKNENVALQGKRRYQEQYRRKKSIHIYILMVCYVVALWLSFLFSLASRYISQFDGGYPIVLLGVILDTLFGFCIVIVYTKLRRPMNETKENSKYSIRRSVQSRESLSIVTGGYKPKRSQKTDCTLENFGIYMGNDDDGAENEGIGDLPLHFTRNEGNSDIETQEIRSSDTTFL